MLVRVGDESCLRSRLRQGQRPGVAADLLPIVVGGALRDSAGVQLSQNVSLLVDAPGFLAPLLP